MADTKISAGTPNPSPALTDTFPVYSSGQSSTDKFVDSLQQVKNVALSGALPLTGIITPTQISSNQNDYSPTGLATASTVRISSSRNYLSITGIAAQTSGTLLFIHNVGSFIINLPNASTASTAANRFSFDGDVELGANDCVLLNYDSTTSTWRLVESDSHLFLADPRKRVCLVGDCVEALTTDIVIAAVSGAGASIQKGTYGVNATQKAFGVNQIDTGTTNAGRATVNLGAATGSVINDALGPVVMIQRVAVEALSTVAEEFKVSTGLFISPATFTSAVCWQYDRVNDGDFWVCKTIKAGVGTTKNISSFAVTTSYVWLAIFINSTWTSVEFFYSNDGKTWTHAFTHSDNIPNVDTMNYIPLEIVKSAGITQRNADLDCYAFSYEFTRSNT